MAEILEELQPAIVCLAETHLSDEEYIEIPGYEIHRCDENSYKGGLLFAVNKKIAMVTTKLSERNDVGQALWTLIDNGKYKMRIGLIYAPQENKTLNKDLQKIYQEIEEQAKAAT